MKKTLLFTTVLLCRASLLPALEAPCDPNLAGCQGNTVFPQPPSPRYTPADPSRPGMPMPSSPYPTSPSSLGTGAPTSPGMPDGSPLPPLPDVEISPSRLKTVREFYPSGEIAAERRTFDGQLDGLSKEFYKNGQVMNEWNYRLGVLEGESRSFYRNGDLKTVSPYRKGRLHGELRRYHERKILKSVETHKDGQLLGTKLYSEQGLPLDDR